MANKRDLLRQTDVMQRRVTLDDLVGEMIGTGETAQENGLAVIQDGRLVVHGFMLTSVGLVAPGGATFEDWQAVGDVLRRLESGMQWLIGDWYRLGEHQWGSMYQEAAEALGYSAVTLRDFSYVARNVDLSVRTDNLSFAHHKLVAALEPAQQAEWLRWAEAAGASVAKLRKALRGEDAQALPEDVGAAVQTLKRYTAYVTDAVTKNWPDNPDSRKALAMRAEWLAAYYADLARQARG